MTNGRGDRPLHTMRQNVVQPDPLQIPPPAHLPSEKMITMRKLTTHSTWTEYAKALNAREAFKTSGALWGERGDGAPEYGRLPSEHRDSVTRADYVVYSYHTPIAWYDIALEEWVIPDVRYSTTASKHQSKIRTAVGELS